MNKDLLRDFGRVDKGKGVSLNYDRVPDCASGNGKSYILNGGNVTNGSRLIFQAGSGSNSGHVSSVGVSGSSCGDLLDSLSVSCDDIGNFKLKGSPLFDPWPKSVCLSDEGIRPTKVCARIPHQKVRSGPYEGKWKRVARQGQVVSEGLFVGVTNGKKHSSFAEDVFIDDSKKPRHDTSNDQCSDLIKCLS